MKYLLLVGVIAFGGVLPTVYPDSTVAANLDVAPDQRQVIQQILDSLATAPEIDTARQSRQKLKNYISGFTQKIELLDKEISQLESALVGIGNKESGGPVQSSCISKTWTSKFGCAATCIWQLTKPSGNKA